MRARRRWIQAAGPTASVPAAAAPVLCARAVAARAGYRTSMMIGPNVNARRSAPPAIIKAWVRRHCSLDDDVTVLVAQLACHEPACPPIETVISILDGTSTISVHLHKPLSDVTEGDVVTAFGTTQTSG